MNTIKIYLDNLTKDELISLAKILYTAGTVEDVKKVDEYIKKFLEEEERRICND